MSKPRNTLIALAMFGAPLAPSAAFVPTTTEQPAQGQARADAEDAIQSLREMMLPAGEREEDWKVGGADIEKDVRALGPDKFYALEIDAGDGSAGVTILTDRPIADFAPSEWRVVESYGSPGAVLENATVTFAHLSPRYVLAGRVANRHVESVICTAGISHAILYELPGGTPLAEDKYLPDFVKAMMLAIEGLTLCSRHDGDPSKGYSVRNYFADGRRVLNPDRSVPADRVVIVPAAPVASLLKPPPPAPATP